MEQMKPSTAQLADTLANFHVSKAYHALILLKFQGTIDVKGFADGHRKILPEGSSGCGLM